MADNNATTPVPPPAAGGAESPAEKSKNADKNEAKRLAKMEKFLAKQKVFECAPSFQTVVLHALKSHYSCDI